MCVAIIVEEKLYKSRDILGQSSSLGHLYDKMTKYVVVIIQFFSFLQFGTPDLALGPIMICYQISISFALKWGEIV